MSWIKDLRSPGIQTRPQQQESKAPSDLWTKCVDCGAIMYRVEIERNHFVCLKCSFHFTMPARKRLELLLDPHTFEEKDADLRPKDVLQFVDTKSYLSRIQEAEKKSGEKEAALWGFGKIDNHPVSIATFVFEYMGGSMGAVVGEKITRCFEEALRLKIPAIVISSSGGARMQEGIFSLMQLAKTCAALEKMKEAGLPYISILTHPTTGGVAASFAMLGDIHLAEPGALIGFAGPRVIEQTIRQKLPEGFQRSQFLLEHGMVDAVVPRKDLRKTLAQILRFVNA